MKPPGWTPTRPPAVNPSRLWRRSRGTHWSALLLLGITCLSLPAAAQSVAVVSSSFNSGSAQASWSHTVPPGGQNRYLLVGVSVNHSMRAPVVTEVTFVTTPTAGMNVVQSLARVGETTSPGQLRVEIWGLVAPATGLGVLTVRLDGPGGFVAGGLSFTGVHQSSSTRPMVSNLGTGVTATLPIPSDIGEVVVSVHAGRGVVLPVPRAPHVGRWAFEGLLLGAGGTEDGRPGITVVWDTPSASQPWLLAGLGVLPAAATAVDAGPPDTAPPPPDMAPPPPDTAPPPPDTAPPPPDTAPPPPDMAPPPADTAPPPVDTAAPPVDGASPSPDTASPVPDAASPLPDTGAPLVDAAPLPPDAGPASDAAPGDGAGSRSDARYRVGCACRVGAGSGQSEGAPAGLCLLIALVLVARAVRRSRS